MLPAYPLPQLLLCEGVWRHLCPILPCLWVKQQILIHSDVKETNRIGKLISLDCVKQFNNAFNQFVISYDTQQGLKETFLNRL